MNARIHLTRAIHSDAQVPPAAEPQFDLAIAQVCATLELAEAVRQICHCLDSIGATIADLPADLAETDWTPAA